MEKITLTLPRGAEMNDLKEMARNYNICLKESDEKYFTGITPVEIINIMGSIAGIISFFMFIKDKYGRGEVIKIEITNKNGEKEKRTLEYLINYLNYLKSKNNDSSNG